MGLRGVAIPWFRREDYDRIRQMCDDELPGTFDQWEKMVQKRLDERVPAGVHVEKVVLDPDDLAAFATSKGAEIDASVRAELAALKAAEKYGRDH